MGSLYVKHPIGATSLGSVLVEKRISFLGFLLIFPSFLETKSSLPQSRVPASGLDVEPLASASYLLTCNPLFKPSL
jgi:hypothetical protein